MLETIGQVLGLASSAKSLFGGSGGSESSSLKKQYAWNAYSARHLPSAQVEGLRAAGLNPMLALGMGGSMPNTPPATISPGKDADIATARTLAAATTANQAAQAKLYDKQADKVEAETQTEKLRPNQITAQTALTQAQEATEKWGPENKKWATELLSAQFGKTVAEKDAISLWQRKLVEAQTVNMDATTKLINEQIKSAKTKADLDAAYMELERIIAMGAEGAGAVSGLVSSAAGLRRAVEASKPRTTIRSGRSGKGWFNETTTSK